MNKNYFIKKSFWCLEQENEKLKQQLADLQNDHDILIDYFQEERKQLCGQIKQHSDARKRAVENIKKLRHEICEKIRKKIDKYEHVTWVLVRNILDQIEKGKE